MRGGACAAVVLPHSRACCSGRLALHHAPMSDLNAPKLAKWPFFLGDALLLGLAELIVYQCKFPLRHWELCFVVLCVAAGAVLGIAPFLLEYVALVKVAEAGSLTTVVSQLGNPEGI